MTIQELLKYGTWFSLRRFNLRKGYSHPRYFNFPKNSIKEITGLLIMDKDPDIQLEEAVKAYLASGVEKPGE